MVTTKHLRISGRVQGVGFRAHMLHKARGLGVTGWVRNRLDGTVEAVVQGPQEAVEAMIAWARRGPPGAVITELAVSDEAGRGAKTQRIRKAYRPRCSCGAEREHSRCTV